MSKPTPLPPGYDQRDYEDRDIPLKAILVFGFFIALFTAATFVAVRWLFFHYEHKAAAQDRPASPFATERILPPEPRLQTDERRTLREQLAHEAGLLERYSWVDRQAGTVRIPVEQAMDLVVERGLPVSAAPEKNVAK